MNMNKKTLEDIFRENLRFYRTRAKLSQEKLSALVDKNINYINMIEGGKSIPPLSMIEKISEVLKVEPNAFLIPHRTKEAFDKEKFLNDASIRISEDAKKILSEMIDW